MDPLQIYLNLNKGHFDGPYSIAFENRGGKCLEGACHLKTHGQTTVHGVAEVEIRATCLQIKQHKAVPENRQEEFPPTGFRASVVIGHVDLNFQPVRTGMTVANHSLWAAPLLERKQTLNVHLESWLDMESRGVFVASQNGVLSHSCLEFYMTETQVCIVKRQLPRVSINHK